MIYTLCCNKKAFCLLLDWKDKAQAHISRVHKEESQRLENIHASPDLTAFK